MHILNRHNWEHNFFQLRYFYLALLIFRLSGIIALTQSPLLCARPIPCRKTLNTFQLAVSFTGDIVRYIVIVSSFAPSY